MPKISVSCSWCGAKLFRYPSQISNNSFCKSECRSKFLSKKHNPKGYIRHPHLTEFNLQTNPTRMTDETRWTLRQMHLGKGQGKTYEKTHGRHTHRVIAERMLGRKLKKGEVVHHIDGDKRNNSPENLMVFKSQKDHLAWHRQNDGRFRGGGAQ